MLKPKHRKNLRLTVLRKQRHLTRWDAEFVASSVHMLQAAYFAGLVDGEGSIVTHLCSNHHARGKGFTERIRLSIAMTESSAMEEFHHVFCGCFRRQRKPNPRWKDCFFVELNGWRAYAALRAIEPYLITKRRQAKLAIEFQLKRKTLSGTRMEQRPAIKAERQKYHLAIRKLNKRGA
jgi:hypothetical protein